jgi:hypothetical protein
MKGNGEKILGCCRIATQAIHDWIISNAPFNNVDISLGENRVLFVFEG